MELIVNNYTFWVQAYTEEGNPNNVFYNIGNPKGIPCIRIDVDLSLNILFVNDVKFDQACAKEGLPQHGGTIDMLQGALKALRKQYKQISQVHFSDKSYWDAPQGNVPLPERRTLAGKPTWYQEHMGAIPATPQTQNIYHRYQRASHIIVTKEMLKELRIKSKQKYIGQPVSFLVQERYARWTEDQIRILVQECGLPHTLSGTVWSIPMKVVKKYPVKVSFRHHHVQHGGGKQHTPIKLPYRFTLRK